MDPVVQSPRRHLLVWFCVGVIGLASAVSVGFGYALGLQIQATFVTLGAIAIIATAVINRKHNHDHVGLLVTATILAAILAAWWTTGWFLTL